MCKSGNCLVQVRMLFNCSCAANMQKFVEYASKFHYVIDKNFVLCSPRLMKEYRKLPSWIVTFV